MAGTRTLSSDPLRNFKFNVFIGINPTSNPAGMARLGFMSVSGLGIQIEPLTYREGGDNLTTRKMPGQADFNPVTLSRGLFPTDFDNWYWMTMLFSAMYGGSNAPLNMTDFRTTMYINILQHPNNLGPLNSSGNYGPTEAPTAENTYPHQYSIVQVSLKLFNAWIGSLAYSDMDAGGNAVAIEQMTLNYEGFDMQWGQNGYVANPVGW